MIADNEQPDWIKRLIDEKNQLEDKVTKLEKFVDSGGFFNLTDFERQLLRLQHHHMKEYLDCLAMRIQFYIKG